MPSEYPRFTTATYGLLMASRYWTVMQKRSMRYVNQNAAIHVPACDAARGEKHDKATAAAVGLVSWHASVQNARALNTLAYKIRHTLGVILQFLIKISYSPLERAVSCSNL